MIEHTFVCDECGVEVKDRTTKEIHRCYKCGKDMRWDTRVGIHGNYQNPIHSDALAVNPEQRKEHERMFPNVRLDGQNRPVFDNFVDHQNYLDKTGFVKRTQKIKPRSRKI